MLLQIRPQQFIAAANSYTLAPWVFERSHTGISQYVHRKGIGVFYA